MENSIFFGGALSHFRGGARSRVTCFLAGWCPVFLALLAEEAAQRFGMQAIR